MRRQRGLTAILAAVIGSAVLAAPASARDWDRCPATFRVLHNDRIGKLELPAGTYRISVKRMTCQDASDKFRRFLDIPSGNLPDNWRVRANKSRLKNEVTDQSFQVKRVGS